MQSDMYKTLGSTCLGALTLDVALGVCTIGEQVIWFFGTFVEVVLGPEVALDRNVVLGPEVALDRNVVLGPEVALDRNVVLGSEVTGGKSALEIVPLA